MPVIFVKRQKNENFAYDWGTKESPIWSSYDYSPVDNIVYNRGTN